MLRAIPSVERQGKRTQLFVARRLQSDLTVPIKVKLFIQLNSNLFELHVPPAQLRYRQGREDASQRSVNVFHFRYEWRTQKIIGFWERYAINEHCSLFAKKFFELLLQYSHPAICRSVIWMPPLYLRFPL